MSHTIPVLGMNNIICHLWDGYPQGNIPQESGVVSIPQSNYTVWIIYRISMGGNISLGLGGEGWLHPHEVGGYFCCIENQLEVPRDDIVLAVLWVQDSTSSVRGPN